jgi:3D (Asp-Asp-Asp) domain-containing protein
MLGSDSLDDALSRIDSLNAVATQSERVVSVTTAARSKLSALHTKLAAQRTRIDAAVADARGTLETLSAARGARVAFITKLRTQEQLKTARIHALEARAQLAERKSVVLQNEAGTTPVDAAPAPEPPGVGSEPVSAPAPPTGGRAVTVSSTGYSLPGHTATGLPVGWGVVAVDPSVIPLGTKLTIPGYGEAVAADTGGGVRGHVIDIWFPTLAQARAWGRRTVTITLH